MRVITYGYNIMVLYILMKEIYNYKIKSTYIFKLTENELSFILID